MKIVSRALFGAVRSDSKRKAGNGTCHHVVMSFAVELDFDVIRGVNVTQT